MEVRRLAQLREVHDRACLKNGARLDMPVSCRAGGLPVFQGGALMGVK